MRGRIGRWLLLATLAGLGGLIAPPAGAEPTPANRFSASMADIRGSLKAFAETIDGYNRSIKEVTDFDLEAAKTRVAEIRELTRALLDQLSDGSALARSHTELSRWIERNRRMVRTDSQLSRERKEYLEKLWSQRADEIEKAGREITAMRKDLLDQLNRVIGDETFLTQLLFLEKAGDAAGLVRQFLSDIKAFSDSLRQRMEALPVPAPGT